MPVSVSSENDPPSVTELLSIAEVERQTGIRPATLRMWERRYGFPQPLRDRHGNRVYPMDQVERLHTARRRLDQGLRPGQIFSTEFGPSAAEAAPAGAAAVPDPEYGPLLELLRGYRRAELHRHFQYRLLDLGLRRFVIEFLAPLSTAVGLAWGRGELPIRCEHLYSQLAMSFLHAKQAAVRATADKEPRVVLATPQGEVHGIGILMVEAVLATFEADCIQLGNDLPPREIVAAAVETGTDIVALSFSSYLSRKSVRRTIDALRLALPETTMLWVGGAGAGHAVQPMPGVYVFDTLGAIEPALLFWRACLRPSTGRR